jgi:Amt family ammonium transporter
MVGQLGVQLLAVAVTAFWSGLATLGLCRLLALATPARVDAEAEHEGLDIASHGERAYEFTS